MLRRQRKRQIQTLREKIESTIENGIVVLKMG
jgi:hypothetical protein